MRKLLRSLALLLLPILLYYGVFLIFEPNNYFGLRQSTPSGAVFGAIRQYRGAPADAVILGDSRMAHFNMELVEQAANKRYGNLAFGGASLKEQLDLLDWLLYNYPGINEVVFGLSFYTLNAGYRADRFEAVRNALYNPFSYLTNLSFNLDALNRAWLWLNGQVLDGGKYETEDPADYAYAPFTDPATGETVMLRERIINYMADVAPYTHSWAPAGELFERLLNTIENCCAAGIRFIVVMPPMDDAFYRYEVVQTGIARGMEALLRPLNAGPALVLDYEFENRPPLREDQFFDGLHLDYNRGLPVWTGMLFADIAAAKEAGYGA